MPFVYILYTLNVKNYNNYKNNTVSYKWKATSIKLNNKVRATWKLVLEFDNHVQNPIFLHHDTSDT